jgi:hypothetical protein
MEAFAMVDTSRTVRALTLGLILAAPAISHAGPPLICHPFQTGNARLLPWADGAGWNNPDPRYNIERLTADTLRLLSPSAPVLARMETLRRATIYAARDPRLANELLAALLARALSSAATSAPDPHAIFDAGYLIESYKQAVGIHSRSMLRGGNDGWTMREQVGGDGYALVTRAMALTGGHPEMEFAASLMREGAASAEHRRRATAAAVAGSLLAQNLKY